MSLNKETKNKPNQIREVRASFHGHHILEKCYV